MLGPEADVVVLVAALDLPARVARVRLEVEARPAQPAARGNVVPAPRPTGREDSEDIGDSAQAMYMATLICFALRGAQDVPTSYLTVLNSFFPTTMLTPCLSDLPAPWKGRKGMQILCECHHQELFGLKG